jgi:hypothetical protein
MPKKPVLGELMIPPAGSPVWRKIATGQIAIPSSKLAVNLLVTNIRVRYSDDPSEANVQALARRAHQFFTQYETVFPQEVQAVLKN